MVMEVLPGNGLQSTLNGAITNVATTLTIQSGDVANWPASGQYRAVLCQDPTNGPFELVKVTGGQGTATLTVTRAAEAYNGDTTAKAWASGTSISAVLTHDGLDAHYLPISGGTLTGNLLFSPDGTYNIGASGATRPQSIYAATSVVVGPSAGPLTLGSASSGAYIAPAIGGSLMFATAGSVWWNIDFTSGGWLANTDNTTDIGASGANRPRTVYAATSVVIGADINLFRGTLAGSMDQRGGATSQSYRLYVAYTDSSNYERLRFTAATTGNTIVSEALGTGTVRDLTIGTTGAAGNLRFQTTSTIRWLVNTSGHFVANTDNAVDIGATGANRPRNLYLAGFKEGLQITTPANPPANNRRFYAKTDGWYDLDSAGVETKLGAAGGGGVTLPLGQTLTFSPDATYDIGASGATRPRNVYAAGGVATKTKAGAVVDADFTTPVDGMLAVDTTNNALYFRSGATWRSIAAGALALPLAQNLTWTTDNTYDIGAAAANRPRNLYVAGSGTFVANVTVLGQVNVTGNMSAALIYVNSAGSSGSSDFNLMTNSGTRWLIQNAGHFLPWSDNSFDIGASSQRPRNIYVGNSVTTSGPIAINGAALDVAKALSIAGITTASATHAGIQVQCSFDQSATTRGAVIYAAFQTTSAVYTMALGASLYVEVPFVSGNTAVTTMYGLYVANQANARITNAYGVYIANQSGAATTNIGLYNAGSSQLNGLVSMGGQSPATSTAVVLNANGLTTGTAQYGLSMNFTASSAATLSVMGLGVGIATTVSVTTAYSIWIGNPGVLVGTVSTLYGLYVVNQGGTGVTNAYGIYIEAHSGAATTNISLYNAGSTRLDGSLTWQTDSTYDIGASGANRPRNLFLGNNLTAAANVITPQLDTPTGGPNATLNIVGNLTVSGGTGVTATYGVTGGTAVTNFIVTAAFNNLMFNCTSGEIRLQTAATSRWIVQAAGHLIAGADNTYDIGASGATRPRDLFLSRNLSVGGNTNIGGGTWTSAALYVSGSTGQLLGASQYAVMADTAFSSAATSSGADLSVQFRTVNASFTMSSAYGLWIQAPGLGTGAAVTSLYGVRIDNQGRAGVTNAYGLYIAAHSGASSTNIGLYNLGDTRLDGFIGIGGPPAASAGVTVTPSAMNAAISYGINVAPAFGTSVTTSGYSMLVAFGTSGVFTMTNGYGIAINAPTVGSSTITNLYGIRVFNQGASGVTNAYGVHIAAQSGAGTTNIGLYNLGTSRFDDTIGIATAPDPAAVIKFFTTTLTGTNQWGINGAPTFSSSATAAAYVYRASFNTAAASFTMSSGYGVLVDVPFLGAGTAITNLYGINVANQGKAGVTNAYGIYLLTTSGAATTNLIIGSAVGATLTTAGSWTNAPSWAAQKDQIRLVPDSELTHMFDWLTADHKPVRYRHPEIRDAEGELIIHTPEGDYDHFGFLLDDVPQDIREVWCVNASGGLSTKDTEGFLLAMLKVSGQRIKSLEARLNALEAD